MKIKTTLSVSLLTLLLTACGGGGGGGGGNSGTSNSSAGNSNVSRETVNNVASRPVTNNNSGTASGSSTTGDRVTAGSAPAGNASSSDAASRNRRSNSGASPVAGTASAGVSAVAVASPGAGVSVAASAAPAPAAPVAAAAVAAAPVVNTMPPPSTSGGRALMLAAAPPAAPAAPAVRYDGYTVSSDNGFHQIVALNSGRNSTSTNLFTITAAKDKITVVLPKLSPTGYTIESSIQDIKELKDIDGSLLGYYGWVRGVSVEKNRNGTVGHEKYPLLDIFYAIDESKSILPTQNNVQYKGTFNYVKLHDSTLRQATDAIFSYKDKKIDGSIREYRGSTIAAHWVVAGDKTVSADDGSFNIRLTSQLTGIDSGTMQGGFFGKEGQIMAARAESTSSDTSKDQWAGVFVGTRQAKP